MADDLRRAGGVGDHSAHGLAGRVDARHRRGDLAMRHHHRNHARRLHHERSVSELHRALNSLARRDQRGPGDHTTVRTLGRHGKLEDPALVADGA